MSITPGAEKVRRRYACCACCEGIALDDHVGHGGSIEKDGHDGPCESCERAAIAASLVAAAKAEALREFADTRGVNTGDVDDEWWRGYRQAQRECVQDALRFQPTGEGGLDA